MSDEHNLLEEKARVWTSEDHNNVLRRALSSQERSECIIEVLSTKANDVWRPTAETRIIGVAQEKIEPGDIVEIDFSNGDVRRARQAPEERTA